MLEPVLASGRAAGGPDIPFAFSILAVNVVGIVHVKNPIEDTWVEGTAAGVINGTFKLSKDKQEAKLYGGLFRLVIQLNVDERYLRARIDTWRFWDGKWSKGSWAYARW